jgi:hypothetical protein
MYKIKKNKKIQNWKPYVRRPCEREGSVIAHLVSKLAAIVESYTTED